MDTWAEFQLQDRWVVRIAGGVLVATLGLLAWAVFELCQIGNYHQRLMRECLADGHREYECYALIHGRDRNP